MFAAVGFLIGGIDDMAVDALFFARVAWRRSRRGCVARLADLPPPSGRIAVLIPAWNEAAVIGAMLRTALDRWQAAEVRLYVGAYPNDWNTIEAVAEVAEGDARVRLVVGSRSGPTTKADCLNTVWRAIEMDEAHQRARFDIVAFHDAEDVVHAGELAVYAHCLATYDAVQLPVEPLPHPQSRWVGGTYLDEFAESHGKALVVRQALGASLPFAGVGCAIRRDLIGRIAASRRGMPFDADSLTEDYELGLTIAAFGGRSALADVMADDGRPVAVRALFPGTLDGAVRQKARWMTGIAFAGWDRTGWAASGALVDHWMRMRDRRAPLAVLVLVAAYLALVLWGVALAAGAVTGHAMPATEPWLNMVLAINMGLLTWRIAMRAGFTWRSYGWREALASVLRMPIGNIVALIAARRALAAYVRSLRGARLKWDKTDHQFPADPDVAG